MATPLSPSTMLATSMHAQPGVYALLLGSGVSTGADMPTGWGVVADLVRKVAAQEDEGSLEVAQADPASWWREHHDEPLGYSSLLESLAPTAAARQGLLAGYFEPTDEERAEGVKTPSKAHRAIAQLVKKGYVRVVITTNFDRLMEQALEAEGVAPQVIARPEAVSGMESLPHASATVIKLHGDYKDLGSLNTPEELAAYPEQWNGLMERVLDDYGLLISGWSADWDTALVALMEASANRRYPLYWDGRSSKGEAAQRLLALRRGTVIPAAGADELFTEIASNIEALERLAEPPLTTAMAVARLKRYLPDPVRRIDLHDLVMSEVTQAVVEVQAQPLTVPHDADGEWWDDLYREHLEAAQPLLHLLAAGVWHDAGLEHDSLWLDVLQRLIDAGTRPLTQVGMGLDSTRLYPALLGTTVMGLVATRRDRESLVIDLAEQVRGRRGMGHGEPEVAGTLLHPQFVISHANDLTRWRTTRWQAPESHLLRHDLRETFTDLIPADLDYRALFSAYEYRLALIHAKHETHVFEGEWMGERTYVDDGPVSLQEQDFKHKGQTRQGWPWADYFGGLAELAEGIRRVDEARSNSRLRW